MWGLKNGLVSGRMISAGGGGAAYTIASGNFSIPSVANTALLLGLVSGGFYKVWVFWFPVAFITSVSVGLRLVGDHGIKANPRMAHCIWS